MAAPQFREGDLVKHKGSFLRAVSWYTGVPRNGKVVAVDTMGGMTTYRVHWCDGTANDILECHLLGASAPDNT